MAAVQFLLFAINEQLLTVLAHYVTANAFGKPAPVNDANLKRIVGGAIDIRRLTFSAVCIDERRDPCR